jgi:hypothetical protein
MLVHRGEAAQETQRIVAFMKNRVTFAGRNGNGVARLSIPLNVLDPQEAGASSRRIPVGLG